MKKSIYILIIFLVTAVLVFVLLNKKEEATASKDSLDGVEYNDKLLPKILLKEKGEVRFYLGKWVILDEWMGATRFEIIDAGEDMVKVVFNDYTYGGGVGRAADFETEPFRIFEEIENQLYYGRFKWDGANGGWGYLYVNDREANVILEETTHGGGALNKVYSGSYSFGRPSRPYVNNALRTIQSDVVLHEKGYMPLNNVTYIYVSADGDFTQREKYNGDDQTFDHVINWENKKPYEISRKGVSLYNEKEDAHAMFLKFSMEKGDHWESDEARYEVIDDNYPLIDGLEDVVVLKRSNGKTKEFKYYHKNFGLLGWGKASKNKYGHKPMFLLDEVQITK